MYSYENIKFGSVPALFVFRGELERAAKKGGILFFHGLIGSKETHLLELEDLARSGFLAVGIDAVGHGERRYPDIDQRFAEDNPDAYREFLNVVVTTAQEVPLILDSLIRMRLLNQKKIGIAGISLGGHIAYTAIMLETRLNVAATILGSPQWKIDLPESPHNHIEKFSSIRLLSQNAGQDEIVPAVFARKFHMMLKARYSDYDERFNYIEYPDSGHFMTENDWSDCWTKTISWFNHHLQN